MKGITARKNIAQRALHFALFELRKAVRVEDTGVADECILSASIAITDALFLSGHGNSAEQYAQLIDEHDMLREERHLWWQ